MEAKELRIGNLVNYRIIDEFDERKEWYEVSTIDAEDLNNIDEDYQPIPLTDEWLLKFGFEKIERFLYQNYALQLIIRDNKIYFSRVHIESVHRLQNIFFALTNEELTIKNEK